MILQILLSLIFLAFIIVILLLISIVKGISNIMDQQNTIFERTYERISDIYDLFGNIEPNNKKIMIGDEKPYIDHSAMFKQGIEEINEMNEKKSKKF